MSAGSHAEERTAAAARPSLRARPAAAWLRAAAVAVVALAVAAVTLPRAFTVGIGAGLDNSWMAAIDIAAHEHLVFGRDIAFTYGPLGWLGIGRLAYPVQGTLAFAFAVLAHVGLVAGTMLALRRGLGWAWAVLGTLALLSLARWMAPNDEPQVAAVALAALAAVAALRHVERFRVGSRTVVLLAALGGAFAALEILIKLNSGATIAVMGGIAAVAVDPRPPWRAALAFTGSFVVTTVVLWVTLAAQPLGALDDYVRTSLQIVSGHAEALKTEESIRAWEYLAAVVVTGAAIATAWTATAGWSRARRAGALCLLAALLFTSFKQGFIRHDGAHAIQFFVLAAVAVAAFAFAPRRVTAAAYAVALVALLGVVRPPPADLAEPRESWDAFRGSVTAVSRGAEGIAANRDAVRGTVNLDAATVALLRGHTVHIAPAETSVAFGHPEFRWRPLPVFQSYVAYTPALDDLNAALLRSPRAPEFVLRSEDPGGQFVEPATRLELLCRYREVHRGNGWQVLQRGPTRCGAGRRLVARESATTTGPGVPVPQARPGEIVLARLRGLSPGLAERVRALLYKPYDRSAVIDGNQVGFAEPLFARGVVASVPAGEDFAPPFAMGWDAKTLSVNIMRQVLSPQQAEVEPYSVEFWAVPFRAAAP